MKNTILTIIAIILANTLSLHADQTFTLTSTDLKGQFTNKHLFNGFGYQGENLSPQLSWKKPPKGTKSYAITMYDPDAPTGSGWWHWVVFNIPNNVSNLETGAGSLKKQLLPPGAVQSETSFGSIGYGGAAPPKGAKSHAYIITIYALDVEKIDLKKSAHPAMVGFYLNQHTIQKASLISYYKPPSK